jgi:hypothetical protein
MDRVITVRLPEKMADAIKNESARQFTKPGTVIRQAIGQYLRIPPETVRSDADVDRK